MKFLWQHVFALYIFCLNRLTHTVHMMTNPYCHGRRWKWPPLFQGWNSLHWKSSSAAGLSWPGLWCPGRLYWDFFHGGLVMVNLNALQCMHSVDKKINLSCPHIRWKLEKDHRVFCLQSRSRSLQTMQQRKPGKHVCRGRHVVSEVCNSFPHWELQHHVLDLYIDTAFQ